MKHLIKILLFCLISNLAFAQIGGHTGIEIPNPQRNYEPILDSIDQRLQDIFIDLSNDISNTVINDVMTDIFNQLDTGFIRVEIDSVNFSTIFSASLSTSLDSSLNTSLNIFFEDIQNLLDTLYLDVRLDSTQLDLLLQDSSNDSLQISLDSIYNAINNNLNNTISLHLEQLQSVLIDSTLNIYDPLLYLKLDTFKMCLEKIYKQDSIHYANHQITQDSLYTISNELVNELQLLRAAQQPKEWVAKFKIVDGQRDTLRLCRQVSFQTAAGATGDIKFEFADSSTETLPVCLLSAPAWNAADDNGFLSTIIYDATNATGVLLNTIGCETPEHPPYNCIEPPQDCEPYNPDDNNDNACNDSKSWQTIDALCWWTLDNLNWHVN